MFTAIRPHSQVEVATSNNRKALRIVALERQTQRAVWEKRSDFDLPRRFCDITHTQAAVVDICSSLETDNIHMLHLYMFDLDV